MKEKRKKKRLVLFFEMCVFSGQNVTLPSTAELKRTPTAQRAERRQREKKGADIVR